MDKMPFDSNLVNGAAILLSFFLGYNLAKRAVEKKYEGAQGSEEEPLKCVYQKKKFYTDYNAKGYKMVLVVRNDLKIGKGKIGAQCGHAAVGAYQKGMKKTPVLVRLWENDGCAKIALKVESEKELMDIKRVAEGRNLVTCLIRDAGRTQIEPNSKTVLAIGPAAVDDVDFVTGHLKLL